MACTPGGLPGPAIVTSLDELPPFVDAHSPTGRGLLVADGAVVANGYAERLRLSMPEPQAVTIHVVPPGEPTAGSVDTAAEAVRADRDAVVVAAGGGTVLDTAKLAASLAAATAGAKQYALCARPLPPRRPLVAIPTTSGTGSEVTRTCILTDRSGRKVWAWGDELVPDLVVLDPEATVSVPPNVTSATGLDAFVHAVEAATGRRADDAVTTTAVEALTLVLTHLPAAVADGTDLAARAGMQWAALHAGLAIDAGGTGIAHAIGHALGALAGVPHGAAVAVGLGAAMSWNVAGAPHHYAPVADAVGVTVEALPHRYAELLMAARFPSVVRSIGDLAGLDPDRLAAAMYQPEHRTMHDNNCRLAAADDRRRLAEATLRLWHDLIDGGAAGS